MWSSMYPRGLTPCFVCDSRFSAVKRGAVSSSKSKLEYDARMARKAAKKKWQEQKNLFIERRRAEAEVRGCVGCHVPNRMHRQRRLLVSSFGWLFAQEAKLKRIEKKRRKQENEFRSAVTQTVCACKAAVAVHGHPPKPYALQITNAAKIKKMTKKQLRSIKRTRVDPVTGAVELVSPWE